MKRNKIPPPTNWYPQEAQKVIHMNMKPFVYNALPGIPYTNRSNSAKIGMNSMENEMGNQGIQPYFGDQYPDERQEKGNGQYKVY